jgi:putative protease
VGLSVELNKGEIKDLLRNYKNKNLQMLVYGKIELMVNEYCPIGSIFGDKGCNTNCNEACMRDTYTLVDRKNEEFLLKTDIYCRNYIYNNVPINLLNFSNEIYDMGIGSLRLDFIDEDYDQTLKVINAFLNDENLEGNYTKGHYKRGVE